ncbi:glycosyltransferase [Pukyongia salina]|uniref:Glycosyltransferase n=1 Tax=Pukyongia salina TaxID=2094025 RepID=A0A2S0HWN3_9FLAO|nr:TIGR04282 family arsenosugar biosynthesis glycosyltransferase [Pukyongia salina]AVI51040.1 glycosyltransferase [Pukyongia salina]
MNKELLIIFTRNPELGKVKTRLAATVGNKIALNIYKFLLEHTRQISMELDVSRHLYYSEEIHTKDAWDNSLFDKRLQQGEDLGDRMKHAFQMGLKEGYEKVIIIGSDIYELDTADIEDAFSALDHNEVVIGPAADGGYYLLGMRTLIPELFENKEWGSDSVLKDTLAQLYDKPTRLLTVKNDVDTYDDIKDVPAFKHFLTHINEAKPI